MEAPVPEMILMMTPDDERESTALAGYALLYSVPLAIFPSSMRSLRWLKPFR